MLINVNKKSNKILNKMFCNIADKYLENSKFYYSDLQIILKRLKTVEYKDRLWYLDSKGEVAIKQIQT